MHKGTVIRNTKLQGIYDYKVISMKNDSVNEFAACQQSESRPEFTVHFSDSTQTYTIV